MFRKKDGARNPKYAAGDIIRVKSKAEISENIDSMNKLDGCLFMNQMWDYCGMEFKIMRVVRHFFDEHQYKMYKPRAPLYLLKGSLCNGEVASFKHRCDHYCYFFWHEDWLENC
jgi:hypothetical protein